MSDIEKITGSSPEAKSLDITQQNIEQLKQLFPDVFSENKIDFEALRAVLGEEVDDSEERYNFTWNGKTKARQIAQTPSTGTLRPCKEESVNWDTTENLFIEGDNLEVLKLLQKSYHKQVKLIFIDPPYNTGNEFIYEDTFKDSISNYLEVTRQVDDNGKRLNANVETSGRYHSAWLNMMYPRLKLARNLLADDGIIFIAIDDNELANLRKIGDEIWGEDNFIANITWKHTQQSKNDEPYFSRQYNSLIVYRKSASLTKLRFPRTEEDNRNYSNPDNDPKGKWRSGDVRSPSLRPTLKYNIETPNGNVITPPEKGWRWSEAELKKKILEGEIVFNEAQTGIKRKIYLYKQEGRTPENLWNGDLYGTTRQANNEIKDLFNNLTVFDTPKPSQLISRILQLFDDEALVLDFFAGSGTTGHAVYETNEKHSKNFKFILVQLPEQCDEQSIAYKNGYAKISDITRNRLKLVINRLKTTQGFKFFKLDETNIRPWDANFDNLELVLQQAAESIKEGRSSEDVLYEIFLKYGYDLTTPVETEIVNGKQVFVVGAGALIVCLDDEITGETVEGIAKLKEELDPETTQVVFKDAGFADSNIKTNAIQILKQVCIDDVKSI